MNKTIAEMYVDEEENKKNFEREFSERQWSQPNDVVTWRQSDKHAILLSGDESKSKTFHQDASWKYQDMKKFIGK